MNKRSKSTLFLMEQLIVVAVFAICAAACVRILVASYMMATDSRDMRNAIHVAESGAECYKAVAGDLEKTAGIMGGSVSDNNGNYQATMFYDKSWQPSDESAAAYALRLVSSAGASEPLSSTDLSVEKKTGEIILAFTVIARR